MSDGHTSRELHHQRQNEEARLRRLQREADEKIAGELADRIIAGELSIDDMCADEVWALIPKMSTSHLDRVMSTIHKMATEHPGYDDLVNTWSSLSIDKIPNTPDASALAMPRIVFLSFWRKITAVDVNGDMRRMEKFHKLYAAHLLGCFGCRT